MPTLKGKYVTYNQESSEKENIIGLFEAHNDFVRRVTRTINNLDAENFGDSLIALLGGNESDDEQTNSI